MNGRHDPVVIKRRRMGFGESIMEVRNASVTVACGVLAVIASTFQGYGGNGVQRERDMRGTATADGQANSGSILERLKVAFGNRRGEERFDARVDFVPDGVIDVADVRELVNRQARSLVLPPGATIVGVAGAARLELREAEDLSPMSASAGLELAGAGSESIAGVVLVYKISRLEGKGPMPLLGLRFNEAAFGRGFLRETWSAATEDGVGTRIIAVVMPVTGASQAMPAANGDVGGITVQAEGENAGLFRIEIEPGSVIVASSGRVLPLSGDAAGVVVRPLPGDTSQDGILQEDELASALEMVSAGDLQGDMTGDGIVDGDDITAVIEAFAGHFKRILLETHVNHLAPLPLGMISRPRDVASNLEAAGTVPMDKQGRARRAEVERIREAFKDPTLAPEEWVTEEPAKAIIDQIVAQPWGRERAEKLVILGRTLAGGGRFDLSCAAYRRYFEEFAAGHPFYLAALTRYAASLAPLNETGLTFVAHSSGPVFVPRWKGGASPPANVQEDALRVYGVLAQRASDDRRRAAYVLSAQYVLLSLDRWDEANALLASGADAVDRGAGGDLLWRWAENLGAMGRQEERHAVLERFLTQCPSDPRSLVAASELRRR